MVETRNCDIVKPVKPSFSNGKQKSNINHPEDNYLLKNGEFILAICITRILSFCGWTGGIIYCTYHIFILAEVELWWQKDPIMNPGPFTGLLNRGRDRSDYEWTTFTSMFFSRLIYWYAIYAAIASFMSPKHPKFMLGLSTTMSFLFLGLLIGWLPTVIVFAQPVMYWALLKLRRIVVIWGFTIVMLLCLNGHLIKTIVGSTEQAQYYFAVTAAWNFARCVSFVFDSWDRPKTDTDSFSSLKSAISYCSYFPLLTTGPLILFDSYEQHVYLRQPQGASEKDTISKIVKLMNDLARMLIITVLNELLLHYLYFRPLALSPVVLKEANLWVICGVVYWLGQFFTLKYKVMYGIPTAIAEFDGAKMPPLPKCPAYLHRYSVLWKDFDRGLYSFLVRYTYLPVVKFLDTLDKEKQLDFEIKKLIASFMSFAYIYLWHSTAFDVLIWASLNFLGITIEKIGSAIKRKMDAQQTIEPILWDFVVEPIVTVPLAAMSILNSSVFCGSLESALALATQMWIHSKDNYAVIFLYCFTHLAVTLRTWPEFIFSVRSFLGERDKPKRN